MKVLYAYHFITHSCANFTLALKQGRNIMSNTEGSKDFRCLWIAGNHSGKTPLIFGRVHINVLKKYIYAFKMLLHPYYRLNSPMAFCCCRRGTVDCMPMCAHARPWNLSNALLLYNVFLQLALLLRRVVWLKSIKQNTWAPHLNISLCILPSYKRQTHVHVYANAKNYSKMVWKLSWCRLLYLMMKNITQKLPAKQHWQPLAQCQHNKACSTASFTIFPHVEF